MTRSSAVRKSEPQAKQEAAPAKGVDELVDLVPPHDLSAEAGVIGSMIIDPACIGSVGMLIQDPAVFFSEANGIIFGVLISLYERNTPIDAMILYSTLKDRKLIDQVGGIEYLKQLANAVPSSGHAEVYAAMVKEKWTLRRLLQVGHSIVRDCHHSAETPDALLNRAEGRIFEIAQVKQTSMAASAYDIMSDTLDSLNRSKFDQITGVPTGFIDLDKLLCGLQLGEMIILAARPSVGKTSLALNIVEHVGVDLQQPCAVFSMEMNKLSLGQRLLSSRSGVDSYRMRRGMLTHQDHDRIKTAVQAISGAPIYIDDTPAMTLMDLRTKARQLKQKHGIRLIAVDYLQLMEAKAENRQQEITKISRGIKALARELNVPILCLSQLNRSSETENRLPRTSDLRESGSIEQDADVVMLLHRESVMRRGDQDWRNQNPEKVNEAIVIVAKHRNGACDNVLLTFLDAQTRFVNWKAGV